MIETMPHDFCASPKRFNVRDVTLLSANVIDNAERRCFHSSIILEIKCAAAQRPN
jgi:hypothetical protein